MIMRMKTIQLIGVKLLVVLMSVSFSACSSSEDEGNSYKQVLIDGIYYDLDSQKGYAEVAFYNISYGTNYYGDIFIPSSIKYKDRDYIVYSIGRGAFMGELGVNSISVPSSVQVIEPAAFSACENMVSVTLHNGIKKIDNGAFQNCRSLTSITIPEGITTINKGCFEKCYSLNSLTIPNNIDSIGPYAFEDCKGLTNLIIGENVISIESCAFSGCEGLTTISIPKSVSSIGDNSFRWCKSLTKLEIGENVKSISYSAFTQCPKLKEVYCYAKNPPQTDGEVFDNNIENVTLYVPSEALNEYKSISPWNYFGEILALSNR